MNTHRLRIVGLVLALVGLGFLAGSGVAFAKVQDGYDSLQRFSEAQGVMLSYDDEGNLVDRDSTEEAEAIMSLLVDDWGYPVVAADLDPADPLVNTASEYMFQMATVGQHVMHGSVTVVLDEAVEYEGEQFAAGEYEFDVDGRYWTEFDRMHPIEGPAREMAWTGTVHGLFGELGVGTVTHSALQLGLGVTALLAGLGLVFMALGGGLAWAAGPRDGRTTPADEGSETPARDLAHA